MVVEARTLNNETALPYLRRGESINRKNSSTYSIALLDFFTSVGRWLYQRELYYYIILLYYYTNELTIIRGTS